MKHFNYVAAMLLYLCLTSNTYGQKGCTAYGENASKTGEFNSTFGYETGYFFKSESRRNSYFGQAAGQNTRKGTDNTMAGYWAGSQNFGGSRNTYFGSDVASYANSWNDGNVYLGYKAGYEKAGSSQLVIGNNENKRLIYGEFNNHFLQVNGKLKITGGLYFNSENYNDGLPQPRMVNKLGIRYMSPVSKWVFSSKNSILVGYQPNGVNYGKGNLFVQNSLGVGTISPSSLFEMNTGTESNNKALLKIKGEFNPGFELYSSGKNHNTSVTLSSDNGQDAWNMTTMTGHSLGFFYNNSENLVVSSNGNVGIGVAGAGHQLEVAGSMMADNFVGSASNFPDYVFDQSYEVMPLAKLDVFVKEHKHLPNMPSEKEVVENGMNINNVAIKSVENIENIYLHLIELSKKVDAYGKKVIALERENAALKDQLIH